MMAGLRIGVRSNQGGTLSPVIAQLPSGTQFSASPVVDRLYSIADAGDAEWRGMRRFHLLYSDGALVSRTLKKEELADALDADLRLFVAEWATDRLFVHAGVVGWQDRALVLPGASMSGKTSLVRALLRAGATYYSDDCALLDDEGRVHSFAPVVDPGRERGAGDEIERGGTGGGDGDRPTSGGPDRIHAVRRRFRSTPQGAVRGRGNARSAPIHCRRAAPAPALASNTGARRRWSTRSQGRARRGG